MEPSEPRRPPIDPRDETGETEISNDLLDDPPTIDSPPLDAAPTGNDPLPVIGPADDVPPQAPAPASEAAPAGDSRKALQKLTLPILLQWFAKYGTRRVSDLHIKVGAPPIFRIDGSLRAMTGPPLDVETIERLARSIVSDRDWKVLKEMRSVDTSFRLDAMQYRANVFHDNDGMAIALRALENDPPPIDQIGFPSDIWKDIVDRNAGLVLITGVTGAGKTTTIAALLSYIAASQPCRIITLEDPIEFRLASRMSLISQREVGRDVPTFERGLRDCLREDPDVIFVGEMRDRESAAWTMTAAETGHLVFSTLHTRDARGSISRILDMFPENRQEEVASQLSLGLSHIVCQKLVPRKDGQGRTMAMEILTNSYASANLIRTGKLEQIYSIMQTKTRDIPEERMRTMEQSLAELVASGAVEPEEALRWANNPSEYFSALRHLGL